MGTGLNHLISAVAIVALASPLAAQVPAPTPRTPVGMKPPEARVGSFGTAYDTDNIRSDTGASMTPYGRATRIAKCIVQFNKSRAAGLVGGALAGDPAYSKLERGLRGRYGDCASDLEAPAMMISGALAEQLTLSESQPPADRAPTVNIDEAAEFHGDLSGQVTVESLAGCLAVYSPGLAYKVLATEIGSAEETAALGKLYASTPECGVQETPSGIEPGYQRGALATALYTWTHRNS